MHGRMHMYRQTVLLAYAYGTAYLHINNACMHMVGITNAQKYMARG